MHTIIYHSIVDDAADVFMAHHVSPHNAGRMCIVKN